MEKHAIHIPANYFRFAGCLPISPGPGVFVCILVRDFRQIAEKIELIKN